jgi:predicted nucleic acid binding AN1-type Zn finger protein
MLEIDMVRVNCAEFLSDNNGGSSSSSSSCSSSDTCAVFGSGQRVSIWNVDTGSLVSIMNGHSGAVMAVAVAHSSSSSSSSNSNSSSSSDANSSIAIASASTDRTIKLWVSL